MAYIKYSFKWTNNIQIQISKSLKIRYKMTDALNTLFFFSNRSIITIENHVPISLSLFKIFNNTHIEFLPDSLEKHLDHTWTTTASSHEVLLSDFSLVNEKVYHFFLLPKPPLGHASVSFNHNSTAFPCFHKGFRFWLSCTKAPYIHLKPKNKLIQTASLISNYACHPSATSWNLQSLAVLIKTPTTLGNTFIIISLMLTQFHHHWLQNQWVGFAFPNI